MARCTHCGAEHSSADHTEICPRTGARLANKGPCGSRIERYEIIELLESGGFGSVYIARHVHTKKRVALKILTKELAADPTIVKRFEREAQAMAAIDSPHIVQVSDWGAAPDGEVFLVMELLEGDDLRTVLNEQGKLPEQRAVDIALQILVALDAAHSLRIVHRDLKPANIFLVPSDNGGELVKLLDFGISKIDDDSGPISSRLVTATGAAMGTPRYMAPEQLRAQRDIDGRADVYACAVVLFRMLAGRQLFETECYEDLVVSVCTEVAPTLTEVAPWVPPALSEVVARGLLADRELRWSSAAHFSKALREASSSSPSSEDPDTVCDRAGPTESTTRSATSEQPKSPTPTAPAGTPPSKSPASAPRSAAAPKSRQQARSSTGLIVAACVVGASAIISSWMLSRDRADPTASTAPSTTAHRPPAPTPVETTASTANDASTAQDASTADGSAPKALAPRPSGHALSAPKPVEIDKLSLTTQPCARDADCRSWTCKCKSGSTPSKRLCSVAHGRCVGGWATCRTSCLSAGLGKSRGNYSRSVTKDADCYSYCPSSGRCTARDGKCVATSDADCRKSSACAGVGRCFARDGNCKAGNEQDCRKARGCLSSGTCGYADGHCRAIADKDCKASYDCQKDGRCSLRGSRCEATTNADCAGSYVCKRSAYCNAVGGSCRK